MRHRLECFYKQLRQLEDEHGTPDSIVIEFAREDFTPKKQKQNYEKKSKENNKLYEKTKEELKELYGDDAFSPDKKLVSKYLMAEKQGWICPYTGERLCHTKLNQYEIEHIIPRTARWQGPDSIENKVLTTQRANSEKGDRAPYEWITDDDWENYKKRVEDMQKISGKTKKLLLARTRDEVEELIERYYGLATTGYVARLARDIACLWFDWQPNAEGEKRKMHVVSGSLVGKIRRKYGLNKALNPFLTEEDAKKDEKNREDKRHHALDAMVMTYLEEWGRNPRNFNKLELPKNRRDAKYFEEKLAQVMPHKIARNKARLGETAYGVITHQVVTEKNGKKKVKEKVVLVGKDELKNIKPNKIVDSTLRQEIEEFLKPKPTDEEKEKFYNELENGARGEKVINARKIMGDPTNTKNLSKVPFAKGSYYVSKKISGTGTLQHGIYLYSADGEKWQPKPVYAFDSPYLVKKELIEAGYVIKDNKLYYAGCVIEVLKPVDGTDIDTGFYTVKTIKTNGQLNLKRIDGQVILTTLTALASDFRFVK